MSGSWVVTGRFCVCLISKCAQYYGQNTKIRETLNNLILNSPQDWQTGVALPFVRIQGTTVEWDVRAKQHIYMSYIFKSA